MIGTKWVKPRLIDGRFYSCSPYESITSSPKLAKTWWNPHAIGWSLITGSMFLCWVNTGGTKSEKSTTNYLHTTLFQINRSGWLSGWLDAVVGPYLSWMLSRSLIDLRWLQEYCDSLLFWYPKTQCVGVTGLLADEKAREWLLVDQMDDCKSLCGSILSWISRDLMMWGWRGLYCWQECERNCDASHMNDDLCNETMNPDESGLITVGWWFTYHS